MNRYDIIITGAGPAGIFCALNSSLSGGRRILLLEKNSSPGKKFLLSGSGQCNITHTGSVNDFTLHYGPAGSFVKPALNAFPPGALINFLNENGIRTAVRDDGKIFPESMRASDVLSMMTRLCEERQIITGYGTPAINAVHNNGIFTVVSGSDPAEKFHAPVLVIASGGESFPSTGSTGDGYILAQSLGHKVIPTTPSLAPVYVRSFPFSELSGISFRERRVSLYRDGRKISSSAGDILITRKGLSGPAILDMSRYIAKNDVVEISFADRTEEEINSDFISQSRSQGKKSIKNFLKSYELPERLISLILVQEGIDPQKNISEINRDERVKLLRSLTSFPLVVAEKGGFETAMATSGGVSREEIDRRTMESKIVPGLFFAGEVIDVDGDTGGYNIQWAFSSGKAAAEGIINRI